ncbi:THUMP-like domain-containing protein [Ornithinimicrobium sp. INDO-MA30-4]|uniref:THUMP-like domain-containing protein n=1 Tax=Ornithinimicrobium sp. INDO-MA30-4 TaxID=2908651 RepID=UPI0037CA5A8D
MKCYPQRQGHPGLGPQSRRGNLTLKRRGHGPDPEVLRKQLKLKGKAEATLVLTRAGNELVAIWVELDGPSHSNCAHNPRTQHPSYLVVAGAFQTAEAFNVLGGAGDH